MGNVRSIAVYLLGLCIVVPGCAMDWNVDLRGGGSSPCDDEDPVGAWIACAELIASGDECPFFGNDGVLVAEDGSWRRIEASDPPFEPGGSYCERSGGANRGRWILKGGQIVLSADDGEESTYLFACAIDRLSHAPQLAADGGLPPLSVPLARTEASSTGPCDSSPR
jgi:hypothetical protein